MRDLDPGQPATWGWLLLMFTLGFVGTFFARRYALSRQLVDQPGERRSHVAPTPRGGGVSIVVAMLVTCVAWGWLMPDQWTVAASAGAGLALVAGIGWIDDHAPLAPWSRLAVHVAAASLLGWAVFVVSMEMWFALACFGLAVVLVNVWNFMDGIDGLAISQAMLCGIGLAALAGFSGFGAWLSLSLMAACAGFLPFNFPRARIFLGDVGSGALGYLVALCGSLVAAAGDGRPTIHAWLLVFMPLTAFAVDASLTLGTRILRGERWWQPHVQHLYQRLSRRWGSHARVTCAFALFTLASCGAAIVMRPFSGAGMIAAVFAWYVLGAGIWYFTRRIIRA